MRNGYYETSYYSESSADSVAAAVLSIYLIVLALILVFALTAYILHSVGLYTIAARMGHTSPWLAFIPFARNYFQGELAGEISLKTKKIKNPGVWNLVLPFIGGGIMAVFYIGLFLIIGLGAVMDYNSAGGSGTLSVGSIMGIIFFIILWLLVMVAYTAAYQVLRILINMQIYRRFTTGNMAVVHSVLSAVVPLYEAICTFVFRTRDFSPGMEPPVPPRTHQGPAPSLYGPGTTGVPYEPPYQAGNDQMPVRPYQPEADQTPVQPYQAGNDQTPVQPYQPETDQMPVQPYQSEAGQTPVQPYQPEADQTPIQPYQPETDPNSVRHTAEETEQNRQ